MMVETSIEIEMDPDEGALAVWRRVCGHGGYRVPVEIENYETYAVPEDADLILFYPIVGHGSLQSLQSQHLGHDPCAGNFPEDIGLEVACHGLEGIPAGSFLVEDLVERAQFSPAAMQRRYCSANVTLTIEDALSRPPQFADALYDTMLDLSVSGGIGFEEASINVAKSYILGASFFRRRLQRGVSVEAGDEDGIDGLVASIEHRGEENVDEKYMERNLRSLVYVTSSHDPAVRPGVHRLLDIPVFAKQKCHRVPGVACDAEGANVLLPLETAVFDKDAADGYYTGRQMLPRVRYREAVEEATGVTDAQTAPFTYAADGGDADKSACNSACEGCSEEFLYLSSQPELYGSDDWLDMLRNPPPMPPPDSPSSPPPQSPPPPEPPPPSPPYVFEQKELLARVREAEERVCASVYYRTTAERCAELATDLTERVLWDALSPPSPPPAEPATHSPLPMPPPPSPALPGGLNDAPVATATLSTLRKPGEYQESAQLVSDGFTFAEGAGLDAAFGDLGYGHKTTCVADEVGGLPCVSADLETTCIDGLEHCGSATRNTQDPMLEIQLDSPPRERGAFLWGLRITLPQTAELAGLLFQSAESGGNNGTGYTVTLQRGDGSPVATAAPQQVSAPPEDREFVHQLVLFTATDEELFALGEVLYVQLTLPGAFRQIWLKRVAPIERQYQTSMELSPRPPLPPPHAAPAKPPPPPYSSSCDDSNTFKQGDFFADSEILEVFEEPCGLTWPQCCALAALHPVGGTRGFELSDAGCCAVMSLSGTATTDDPGRVGFETAVAGSGVVS